MSAAVVIPLGCVSCGSARRDGGILVHADACEAVTKAKRDADERRDRVAAICSRLAAALGGPRCELEAGPVGLVVYGPSRDAVARVCARLEELLRGLGYTVRVEEVVFDGEEPRETGWIGTVRFNWWEVGS